jgi:ABC-2 type transport system ATP-binding protein
MGLTSCGRLIAMGGNELPAGPAATEATPLPPMLCLSRLRKAFGSLVAVDDLSFEVARGEVFGLLGPNGAGKSTSIGMAVGLLNPDSGSVEIDGFGSPRTAIVRSAIGVAPQSLALYEELTGEENLTFFGQVYGLGGSRLRQRAAAVLEMVGLTEKRKDRVKTYSGGMKRRLNLGAGVLHDPPVLMLDEPTAGVDPQSRNNILEMVADLAKKGKAVIYTTHYMEEAAKICDRIAIMDRGKILAMGTLEQLLAQHGGKSVVTVSRAGAEERIETSDPLAEVSRQMHLGGVEGLRIDRPDLESVFLSLTGRRLRD